MYICYMLINDIHTYIHTVHSANAFTPNGCHMGTAIKHPVPDLSRHL